MKMVRKVLFTLALVFLLSPLVGLAQCSKTHPDNGSFVVPEEVVPEYVSDSDTVTAQTEDHGVCAGERVASDSGFALAIRSNDEVVVDSVIDGATEGEAFSLYVDQDPAEVGLEDGNLPIQKSALEYEDGALYVASSFTALEDSNYVGFETDTLYAEGDSVSAGISVSVPTQDTLSGLQVDLPFDGPLPGVTKDYAEGTLETNQIAPDTLRALLYTTEDANLPKDSVIFVQAEVTEEGQTIGLKSAYATVGGPGNTQEVDLSIGQSPLYVEEGSADVVVQTDSLSYPETIVGNQTEEGVTLENQGNVPASVPTNVENSLFSAPGSVEVAPDATKTFPVSFGPIRTKFGEQAGVVDVILENNAPSVPMSGTGVGGRGDPTLSGEVDVSDVVMTADIILEIYSPGESERRAADTYPVAAEGDSSVKIGDLQATSGAVLKGGWPDGVGLASSPEAGTAKASGSGSEGGGKLLLQEMGESEMKVVLVDLEGARGVQVEFDRAVRAERSHGFEVKASPSRLLAYRKGGGFLPKDSVTIASGPSEVRVTDAVKTGSAYNTKPLRVERREYVKENRLRVYPSPAPAGVTISVALTDGMRGSIKVYDVLGRVAEVIRRGRLEEGKHSFRLGAEDLPSGVYFVRFRGNEFRATEKVVVLR
jgi:hypothetical protein